MSASVFPRVSIVNVSIPAPIHKGATLKQIRDVRSPVTAVMVNGTGRAIKEECRHRPIRFGGTGKCNCIP